MAPKELYRHDLDAFRCNWQHAWGLLDAMVHLVVNGCPLDVIDRDGEVRSPERSVRGGRTRTGVGHRSLPPPSPRISYLIRGRWWSNMMTWYKQLPKGVER